jgi:hypothetical protein
MRTWTAIAALGTPAPLVEEVTGLLTLQYQYARTGQGWDEYAATGARVAAKMGGPVLAIFGELDNNIVAEKNKAAWAAALEAPSLRRLVPAYFTTIQDWLAKRIRG